MWSNLGYGYTTFVEHYDQQGNAVLRIRNAHQKNLNVTTGDIVNPSDTLGTMDSTGNSTGTHTHWEVWIKINGLWQNVDPLNPLYKITIVGEQSALIPLDGSEPPPIPEFSYPQTYLPKVTTPYAIRLRTLPEVSNKAIIISHMQPNSIWEYCDSTKDKYNNTWYAIRNKDKTGWSAAIYNNNEWIVPTEDLNKLKTDYVKNISRYPINIRTHPFVSINARKINLLYPSERVMCYSYKTDTLGNIWFLIKKDNSIGWSAARYNGEDWIVPVE